MELYIHERPWEQTLNIVKKKLRARNAEPTQSNISAMMRDYVLKGLVDPIALDELTCESLKGTDVNYIKRIENEANKWFSAKNIDIFNGKIQKNIDDYLESLVKNVKPGNQQFSIIFDRFDSPTNFYPESKIVSDLKHNAIIVNENDLLYSFYYTKNSIIDNQLKENIKNIKSSLLTLEDCKKFEGNTFGPKNYNNNRKSMLNNAQKALERNYLTKKSLAFVGKYMVYKLLRLCFDNGLDIIYFENDYNPYHINCIVNEHFKDDLKNYKVNMYFDVLDYKDYISTMISMFNQYGNYIYTGVLEKYDYAIQNMLIYLRLYLPNINVKISGDQISVKKYEYLYNIIGDLVNYKKENVDLLFKYNYKSSFEENYSEYETKIKVNETDSDITKKYKEKMKDYVESYIHDVKSSSKNLKQSTNPLVRIVYGAPGVGKTTILNQLKNDFIIVSRDNATFRDAFYDSIDSENKIFKSEIQDLYKNYNPGLIQLIENKILYNRRAYIWDEYWQYAFLAFNKAFLWAVENNLNILTDIGGTSEDPFRSILNMLKPEYKVEVYALHAKFSEHYTNQLIRSKDENRLITKKDLKINTEKVYNNLLKLLTSVEREYIDVYIYDNTYYNYKLLFTRINKKCKSYCTDVNDLVDKDEIAFKDVIKHMCSKSGSGEKNITLVIVVLIIVLLVFILSQDIFNTVKTCFRKIAGVSNKPISFIR
jgi:hypothetical protein